MLGKLIIAGCLMTVCVSVHATGLTAAVWWLNRRRTFRHRSFWGTVRRLIGLANWIFLLHLVEIIFWALVYLWRDAMPDRQTAFYFSAVTYTTTGYGDLTLPHAWRWVSGIEALTGILMCGWSTAFFFAIAKRMNASPHPAA